MVLQAKSNKFLLFKQILNISERNICKYLHKDKSSKAIRECFLNYFINECNHNFVRSSPVVPYCDPSLAFVNSGMNQFKGVFLGSQKPEYDKVTNSQKCIRVGGKHNDLNVVGLDGYHHTFFEMLGNWSFGSYFKKEACEMAWNLLTEGYKINKGILYVTYFGGDDSLKLEEDLECKDIWRSIGVSEDRILPFGLKDNFWEMGSIGPCGPSTEIHADLLGITNRAKFINKGFSDLTELWNIVFIQYNRNPDGSIQTLPLKHVDTGMGFERLTSLLQGKLSNYDTDLFTNIFSAIKKICKNVPIYEGKFGESDWNHLDTNYRILSDHVRMITVCLADGVIPEQNQKLRRVIRKAFSVCETAFKKDTGLLKELSNYVVESLGSIYPELEKNIQQIHQIIDYEEEIYRLLRNNSVSEWKKILQEEPKLSNLDIIEMPGLICAYKEIKALTTNTISGEFGFKLFDTHGIDEETITKICQTLNLSFDVEEFQNELKKAKIRSKKQSFVHLNSIFENLDIPPTHDFYKYQYTKKGTSYSFNPLKVQLLKVISNDVLATNLEPGKQCDIILDKTNLYTESGGQCSDQGILNFNNASFKINETYKIKDYILHKGILKSNVPVPVNAHGILEINEDLRLNNMRNHTATHLLNAKLKQIKGATCQKSSKVTSKYLCFDVGIFGEKLSTDEIQKIESDINELIKNNVQVNVIDVDSQNLLNMNNVILIPGEIYPNSGIRIIEIIDSDNFQSREPCCGTHVLNTGDIKDFCIIKCQSLGRSTTSIYAVTESRATLARSNGKKLMEEIVTLQKNVKNNIDKPEVVDKAIKKLKQQLQFDVDGNLIIPAVIKDQCLDLLKDINKQIRDVAKNSLNEFIQMEMQNVLDFNQNASKNNCKYIVHYLACSTMLNRVSLQKATSLCNNLPILVISYSDNTVKARCCVPEKMRSKEFDAEKWLGKTVIPIFNSVSSKSKDQDSTLICNMKSKRINIKDWDMLLQKSLEAAKNYADEYLK